MTLQVRTGSSFAAERRYAVDVLLGEFLGLEYAVHHEPRDGVEITFDGRSLRVADGLFATAPNDWLTAASLPPLPLADWDVSSLRPAPTTVTKALPVLYGEPVLAPAQNGLDLGLDVFGGAFFMLTRYEELVVGTRDARDRFPAAASVAERAGFMRRPIVNEYLEVLWSAMRSLWPRLERAPRTYRTLPTHDVDWPVCPAASGARGLVTAARDVAYRRDPRLAQDRLRSMMARRRGDLEADLCFTFDFIMDAAEEHGLRSAFNFIDGPCPGGSGGDYRLDDPFIRRILRRVHDRGHEIGLHPSYPTFRDPVRTRQELQSLQRACAAEGIEQPGWGGRQHFLRWENPTTWQNWEDAGLAYDSTLGFPDRIGFRSGTCFEHPVFNLLTRRPLRLRERPLVIMEMSLLEGRPVDFERNLALDQAAAIADIDELARVCRAFAGDFVVLWHNSRFISRRARDVYRHLLSAG